MKKTSLFTLFLVLPMVVQAQPVEEEITNDTPTYEIEVIETPAQIEKPETIEPVVPLGTTENKQVQPTAIEPIGEITKPEPIESKPVTDSSGTKWDFSAGLHLAPIASYLNDVPYVSVMPTVGLNSKFITSSGRAFNFGLSYYLEWREMYSKAEGYDRYFEHDTGLSLGYDASDTVSINLSIGFNYSLYATTTNDREYTWFSRNGLTTTIKANDQFKFTTGYAPDYINIPDGGIYSSDRGIPSDLDDIRQGNFGFNPDFSASADDIVLLPNTFFINHQAKAKFDYNVTDKVALGLDFNWVFNTTTNAPDTKWTGSYTRLTASAPLWEGGSFKFRNELRWRNFSEVTKRRNRTDFVVGHKINDMVSVEGKYRLQLTNSSDNTQWTPAHAFHLKAKLGF